jgi:murein DD-endopeptidase MepM/ murein hydrolase activator NlpD
MPSTGRPRAVVPALRRHIALAILCVLALGAPGLPTPAVAAPALDHTEQWRWPVEGPDGQAAPSVLKPFDAPAQPWSAAHRGVDLAAAPFDLVRAAGAGTVAFAGPLAGRGVVSVEHAGGLRTTYEPVDATVREGEPVAAGSVLGILEPLTTHCGRTCLHWGLRRGDSYLDPLSLIRRIPPVLLPYGPPIARPPALAGRTWWP